jgi:hypothetical protein
MGVATAVAGVAVVGLTSGTPAFAAPAPPAPPAAPAAPAGHGPDDMVRLDHGVLPVFFCDPAKPHKHHNTAKHPYKCVDTKGPRF